MNEGHPLPMLTALAVPIWIESCKETPYDELLAWVRTLEGSDLDIAYRGDDLLFRSKKEGETARLFNAYAKSIAVLAFCPGGVTVFNQHYEAIHPDHAENSEALRERAASDFGGITGVRNWVDRATEAFRKRTRK